MKTTRMPRSGSTISSRPTSFLGGKLIDGVSKKSSLKNFPSTHKVISLRELPGGPSLSQWLDSQQMNLFGPDHVPVNHFPPPVNDEASMMNDISGQTSVDSSKALNLQLSLENKLRQQTDVNGSPEYVLTWKRWDMNLGPPICALRARQRRISDKGFTGWRSPDHNKRGGAIQDPNKVLSRMAAGHQINLEDQAVLTGWSTASSRDWKDTPGMATTGTNPDGSIRKRQDQLPRQAAMISGTTSISPTLGTGKSAGLNPEFSLWLMGFPEEWLSCAESGTRSSRKSRQSS